MGVIKTIDIKLEDVLGLSVKSILERRLQSIFMRKGLSKSSKQARQFIKHQLVMIKDKIVDVPSYIVNIEEENAISFSALSPFENSEHPERQAKKAPKAEKHVEETEEEKEAEKVSERIEEAKEAVAEEEVIAKKEEVISKKVGETQ